MRQYKYLEAAAYKGCCINWAPPTLEDTKGVLEPPEPPSGYAPGTDGQMDRRMDRETNRNCQAITVTLCLRFAVRANQWETACHNLINTVHEPIVFTQWTVDR